MFGSLPNMGQVYHETKEATEEGDTPTLDTPFILDYLEKLSRGDKEYAIQILQNANSVNN